MATSILWATLYCLVLAIGWVMTLLALPGNWLIVAAAATYAWLVPADGRMGMSWQTVAALAVLAVIGELAELLAASRGVRLAGGSRRSAVLALIGSIVGAGAGVVFGVPIPVVGPLVGAIVFGGLGAAVGAMLSESMQGRTWTDSSGVGWAAFRGRLLGTLAKTLVGSVMVAVALCALVMT